MFQSTSFQLKGPIRNFLLFFNFSWMNEWMKTTYLFNDDFFHFYTFFHSNFKFQKMLLYLGGEY